MRKPLAVVLLLGIAVATGVARAQADPPVYRCPGQTGGATYTNQITPQEAKDRGCRAIEGAPVTVVQTPRPRTAAAGPAGASAPRPVEGGRVDPAAQRARDSDARRILEAELRREEDKLAALQKEFNNGEPERQGNERNYQRYLDRVEALKAQIARSEADVAAIRREIGKLPAP